MGKSRLSDYIMYIDHKIIVLFIYQLTWSSVLYAKNNEYWRQPVVSRRQIGVTKAITIQIFRLAIKAAKILIVQHGFRPNKQVAMIWVAPRRSQQDKQAAMIWVAPRHSQQDKQVAMIWVAPRRSQPAC